MAHVIAARFLIGYSGHTRAAYRRDLTDYFAWCADHGLEVLAAGRATIDAYARHLAEQPRGRAARPASPATVARRLATLSGYYRYAVSEDAIRRSPVEHVRRPKLGQDSPTLGLEKEEAKRLLRVARAHGTRAHALVSLLIFDGLRISEALGARVEDMDTSRGHHLLRVRRKGGALREVTLNPATIHALDTYLQEGEEARITGPIFATRTGNTLDRAEAWRLIRRLAVSANIPSASKISPHSLRHTFVTLAREAGVPLEDVQDHAGHADPRTTRRYDRGRYNLQRSPAYRLGELLAEDDE
ncbi:tyrosine-type recombinase/integrase [Nocardioides humilatus]|uniref:Tyrosine-type recombinase/integrase n=1 Tax=Nocardioides humilatus TaxID=2607660 RepID=A0A5B1L4E6_9ACTN|nr:tyrosine-type recombinase/integrase [Nocardioides humilatus]